MNHHVIDSVQRSRTSDRGYRNEGIYCDIVEGQPVKCVTVKHKVMTRRLSIFLGIAITLSVLMIAAIAYLNL